MPMRCWSHRKKNFLARCGIVEIILGGIAFATLFGLWVVLPSKFLRKN